jgi:hypothetical protein
VERGGEQVSDQIEEGSEFIPSDDITDAEPVGPEDDALHIQEGEQSDEPTASKAAGFDDRHPDDAEGEEQGAKDAEADPVPEADEEHQEDLTEVLRRHYGMVADEPDEELARDEAGPRALADGEFVCQICFLRKSSAQLADPWRPHLHRLRSRRGLTSRQPWRAPIASKVVEMTDNTHLTWPQRPPGG